MAVDSTYLAAFKADLVSLTAEEIFARYVAPDTCRGLTEVDQASLRGQIADHFGIPVSSVMIVGSAKIGFTLRNKQAKSEDEVDRPPFSEFSLGSDIDVAIVSDKLFDEIWKGCFTFWHTSGYANAHAYWPKGRDFREYFFRGWMRPDHLPSEGGFRYKRDWFDFFRRLTSARAAGDYRITAGLYREPYFLAAYQTIAINRCKSGVL
jgi:hypothetical protein